MQLDTQRNVNGIEHFHAFVKQPRARQCRVSGLMESSCSLISLVWAGKKTKKSKTIFLFCRQMVSKVCIISHIWGAPSAFLT